MRSTEIDHEPHAPLSLLRAARLLGVAAKRAVGAVSHPRRVLADALLRARMVLSQGVLRARLLGLGSGNGSDGTTVEAELGAPPRSAPRLASRRVPTEAARLAADAGMAALARTLADPDPAVRMLALDVICELSPQRAAPLLAGTLQDPDPAVRCATAAAAARVRAAGAVFALILALDDAEHDVRAAALLAIEEITGEPIAGAAIENPDARRRTMEELKRWWKEMRLRQLSSELGAVAR